MKNRKIVIELANMEDLTPYNFGEYISYGSKWINFGKNNDYPSYLRSLYLNSPTHQAIIDGSTNMATGEGVEVVDPVKNPISNKWINENFSKDVIKKLISDLKMYGYCLVEVYNGTLVNYVEAIKYRMDLKDEHNKMHYMWYSKDWDYYSYRKNAPVKVPIYTEGCDCEVSVLMIQLPTMGFDYYSPIDYNGSINYISLETEISKYHLSNIKNGLFPSFLINFIGTEYSDEQMDSIEQNINKKFGGSSNTGRAIVGFSATKDEATTLQTVDTPNISETYEFLSKECSEKILIGHGVTSPVIFGIRDSGGGLGNNAQELEQSYYLYYESKLKHYQNYILQLIKKVMNGNMLYADIQFITYNPFNNASFETITNKPPTEYKVPAISGPDNIPAEPVSISPVKQSVHLSEVESYTYLNDIDSIKIKIEDVLINEKVFDGNLNLNSVYRFEKSSNRNNIVTKKFEILSKQGYVFKPSYIIQNTKDFYFMEQTYIKKIK